MKPDINLMLERLKEKWGMVVLSDVLDKWLCADSTDEGLGPNRFEFYAETPLGAVQKAYRTIQRLYE